MSNNSGGGGSGFTLIISLLLVAHYIYGDVYVLLTSEPWLNPMFYVYWVATSFALAIALFVAFLIVIVLFGGVGLSIYAIVNYIEQSFIVIKLKIKQLF